MLPLVVGGRRCGFFMGLASCVTGPACEQHEHSAADVCIDVDSSQMGQLGVSKTVGRAPANVLQLCQCSDGAQKRRLGASQVCRNGIFRDNSGAHRNLERGIKGVKNYPQCCRSGTHSVSAVNDAFFGRRHSIC